jgi:hypothetical protein
VTTLQSTRKPSQGSRSTLMWLLYLCDAALLVTSGLIHLHLWDIAYRHVKTLDVLFLVRAGLHRARRRGRRGGNARPDRLAAVAAARRAVRLRYLTARISA